VPSDYQYFLNAHSIQQNNQTPLSSWGDFYQINPTNQPTYFANGGYNNGPYIQFNGKTQFLQADSTNFPWASSNGQTTFLLVRYDTKPIYGQFKTMFGYTVDKTNRSKGAYFFGDFDAEWTTYYTNSMNQTSGGRNHQNIETNKYYLFTMSYGTTGNNNFKSWINNDQMIRQHTVPNNFTDINGATPYIGGFPGYNTLKNMSVSAIVHYNRLLSDTERKSVQNYLLTKLETGSPTHPEVQNAFNTMKRSENNIFDV
jgi:hypothetical protein